MILLFDVGNTNIVLGIVKENKITQIYRFITNNNLTVDEYYQKINQAFSNSNQKEPIEGAIISSVVPDMDLILVHMMKKYYQIEPLLVAQGLKSGLKIRLENPKQLGADLLCDAVGAYERYGGPIVIVDLGTATKFIIVNEKREFLGGIICPGIHGSLRSLITSAAKLADVTLKQPKSVIGNDTTSAIQSGLIYGHAAMIDGLIAKIKREMKVEKLKIVLTGGLSAVVKDAILTPLCYEPSLLLEGLLLIYLKNS